MITLYQNTLTSHFKVSKSFNSLLDKVNSGDFPLHLTGIRGNYLAGMIRHLTNLSCKNGLVVVSTEKEAQDLVRDLSLFHENVSMMPWWGTMLYKGVSPQASIFGKRVKTLYEMMNSKSTLFVCSLRSFLSFLPPSDYLKKLAIPISVGKELDPVYLERRLQEYGYLRVPRVSVAGGVCPQGRSSGHLFTRL